MLVDDHALVRDGIASLVRAVGHEIVAQVGSGSEALDAVAAARPDLILMDVRMPEMSGMEATRLIKAKYPDLRIVMLTVSDDEQDLLEAVKSGAHGYLLKDLEAPRFFEALELIRNGEAVLPSRLAGKLLEEFREQASRAAKGVKDSDPLSAREQHILGLVAQGLTNKEVAAKAFISENTVKYHMKNILDKLHLRNRAQVIAWAARRNVERRGPGG